MLEALEAQLKCAFQGRGIGGSFLLVGTFSGLTEFSKNAIVPKIQSCLVGSMWCLGLEYLYRHGLDNGELLEYRKGKS